MLADVLRWEHVLDEPPEALAAYGRAVLDETRAAMEAIAAASGYAGAAEAVAAAQALTPTAAGLVDDYRRAVEEARAFVVEHDIAGLPAGEELEVVATPVFLRSLLPFAAYDAPGPFAERQLGFYYVTPPPDDLGEAEVREILRGHSVASLRTTGVHEAYPGHHLQLVSANFAPTLARRIAGLPDGGNLLVEGWAFYCEELMDREGFLDDPVVRLMRLNDQMWRACRVVIDVELHLRPDGPGRGGGPPRRVEAAMNRREAELECRRYAEEPGQAMSYLLGKREVMRLAEQWGAVRGGTLRAFHDELLSWGSLPPAVIAWGMGLGPRPARGAASAPDPLALLGPPQDDHVAAVRLGLVERLVGELHELVQHGGVARAGGYADADRDVHLGWEPEARVTRAAEGLAHAVGDEVRGVARRVGQQHGELLAAVA